MNTFTDYQGEVVEFNGSVSEALDIGLNVNCTGCTRCIGCTGCTRCIGCNGCTGCNGCIGCNGCTGCTGCTRCTGCTGCTGCTDCTGCTGCTRCTGCIGCNGCTGCTRCTGCTGCTVCTRCTYCKGNPIILTANPWQVCIRKCSPTMKIGCQDHLIEDWMSFTDERISCMHRDALNFWKIWKPIIQAVIAATA